MTSLILKDIDRIAYAEIEFLPESGSRKIGKPIKIIIIIIIMTSYAPISSKIELSVATNPRNNQSHNRIRMLESLTDG